METAPLPSLAATPASAAVPSKPQLSMPSVATVADASSTALSSDCMARLNTVIADDIRQLSRDDLDVKRWLNTALSRLVEAAKEVSPAGATAAAAASPVPSHASTASLASATTTSIRKPLHLEEQLVQLLHARVQTHSQELSAGIEDLISSTLVRLPRTTMELTRMAAEAAELTEQLQRIEGVVHPAVVAGSEAYVAELQLRKASESKLQRCRRYLEKAARVKESIRSLQYLVEQRESTNNKTGSGNGSDALNGLEKGTDSSAGPITAGNPVNGSASSGKAAARHRDLDEVAGIIRQAREDLKEITAVDDTFGEQYKAQLELFEQYIEHALEEECVACLLAHQLERATRLMTTLYSIGRADAVLKCYGEQAATQMAAMQQEKLRACVSSGGAGVHRSNVAAAAVAELLRREIIPDDNAFVSRELTFLSSLVRRTLEEAQATSSSKSGGAGASGAAQEAATTTRSKPPGASTPSAATASPAALASVPTGGASGGGHIAVEDDPRAVQALEVISIILHKLYEPVQSTLQPLLTERPDTTNADFVACLSAIQLIKISATSVTTAAPQGMAGEQSSASTGFATPPVTAKDPLEKLAREVTHRALGLFAGLFHEERVLDRYAARVCAPVAAFCEQPLSRALSAVASTATADELDEDSLTSVLTHAIQEVLVYAPEKITTRCTTAWHASLSKMLAQLQPTPSTSQHTLLQYLYIYKRRVRPLVMRAQQSVEDWLSTGTVHERYPTSAAVLCSDLQTRVWAPLKDEVEEAQEFIQKSILNNITRPILATVAAYTSLPYWGNASASADGSSSSTPVAAGASKPLGTYTQGQAAPSSAVRNMGEMLMELPLTLETLGSGAVAECRRNAQGTGSAGNGASDADAEDGVRALIEEQAEEWLRAVVSDVVSTFVKEKVLQLQIGPFGSVPPSQQQQREHQTQRATSSASEAMQCRYAAALEQLTTDLDYVRNILSAVNEESLETVERVLRAVQALPPASVCAVFVVGNAINMTTLDGGAADNAVEQHQQPQQ
ncbi:hypothetical protein, conserved [Leishmania donovani]|uniref:Conserved oligomeric Golgi complex subunit 7 n=1 Tax=Leishmania donovani TaxID=5661 RepID=E9BIF8_LEIDO|nr:hypothetical protein, conserved [Leishmania donovani]CBZ35034.1 hypothetical protein, conserved [Leishmania donovani]